jgi:hypothetical protein
MMSRFFAILLATSLMALSVTAGRTQQIKWCSHDPHTEIGGEGYKLMWQGARGINSWTSGTHGNNAYLNRDIMSFHLQSGTKTSPVNAYYLKVDNHGEEKRNHHYGWLVYHDNGCYAEIPSDALTDRSTFTLAVQGRNA